MAGFNRAGEAGHRKDRVDRENPEDQEDQRPGWSGRLAPFFVVAGGAFFFVAWAVRAAGRFQFLARKCWSE